MDLGLKDKIVVITGGAGGIGKAIIEEYRKEGAKVAICDISPAALDAVKAEFAAKGFELMTKVVNVCKYEEVASFVEDIVAAWGRVDIFINNVATSKIKSLLDFSTDELKQLMDINFYSVFNGCKAAAAQMKKNGGGVIISAASWAGIRPNAGRAPYSIAKAGIIHMTKALGAELAPDNIRVLAYAPAMVLTPISQQSIDTYGKEWLLKDVPMKRFGKPEEIARVVVFISSDAASYTTGCVYEISGGKCCVQNAWYAYDK